MSENAVPSTSAGMREIQVTRDHLGSYTATNSRGGAVTFGTGDSEDFTPVEALLAAIAACSAVDVDFITSKRAEPEEFAVRCSAEKFGGGSDGNFLDDIEVSFRVKFSAGPDGDAARKAALRAVQQSHERLCTVSRTIQRDTEVEYKLNDEPV